MGRRRPGILLLARDPRLCRAVGTFLQDAGWTVSTATTAAQALRRVGSAAKPDIFLIDLGTLPAEEVAMLSETTAKLRGRVKVLCSGPLVRLLEPLEGPSRYKLGVHPRYAASFLAMLRAVMQRR